MVGAVVEEDGEGALSEAESMVFEADEEGASADVEIVRGSAGDEGAAVVSNAFDGDGEGKDVDAFA